MTVNGKPFILVVEDDMPVRNLITTTLESQDYKYETAANGNQAVMAAASGNPDIILMDLGLPDMDGIEVIRKIRTWSVAPVIVISARSDDRDKVEALDAGADDYLTKPFSVEELLARLRSTLRRVQYLMRTKDQNSSVFKDGDLVRRNCLCGRKRDSSHAFGVQPALSARAECWKSADIPVYSG